MSIYIDGMELVDGQCVFYVNQGQEGVQMPVAENSVLVADGQECEISDIKTLKDSDTNISYDFLIDVSGSMSREGMESVKQIIEELVDHKKSGDNVRITLMGNDLVSSDLMTDAEEIKSYLGNVEVTKEDTNLYSGIKEELEKITGGSGFYLKRCLVIFSDGADDQTTGITREEAETAVKESNVPVFTVAVLKDNATDSQLQGAKILGSFARYSAGGQHLAPTVDGYDYADVAGKIENVLDNSLVITANAPDVDTAKNTVTFNLTLSDGSEAAAGTFQTSANIFAPMQENAKQAAGMVGVIQDTVQATAESLRISAEQKPATGGVLIASAVILLLAAVIAIVALKRKRTKQEKLEAAKALSKTVKGLLVCQKTGQEYPFTLKKEIKIGRSSRCQLCIADDSALSEIHCSLLLRDGTVYIMDESSTNGTYVNGVPIVGEFPINSRDIIMIGSYEYQISWR